MLALLKELTRNLVLLLLLATFLEMLLPKSNLRRYVRLVVGLFVMLTMLQPLTQFLDRQGTIRLPIREPPQEQFEAMIQRGLEMGAYHQQTALQAAKERLEQQVEAMLYLAYGTDGVQVNLTLEEDQATGPRIRQATILLPANSLPGAGGRTGIARVEPVLIGAASDHRINGGGDPSAGNDRDQEQLRAKLAGGVSAYLGIDQSLVRIDFAE